MAPGPLAPRIDPSVPSAGSRSDPGCNHGGAGFRGGGETPDENYEISRVTPPRRADTITAPSLEDARIPA